MQQGRTPKVNDLVRVLDVPGVSREIKGRTGVVEEADKHCCWVRFPEGVGTVFWVISNDALEVQNGQGQ